MSDWTVGTKLYSGVGALVALSVLSGVVAITAGSENRMALWLTFGLLVASAGVGAAVIYSVRRISMTLRRAATELRETSEQVVSASSQVS